MVRIFYITFTVISVLMGCNSPNGEYIVYDIQTEASPFPARPWTTFNKEISKKISEQLTGKRFRLQFESDFVIIRDQISNKELILIRKENGSNKEVYFEKLNDYEDTRIEMQLWPDYKDTGKTLFKVDAILPLSSRKLDNIHIGKLNSVDSYFMFAQYGGKLEKYGRVVYFLSKLE